MRILYAEDEQQMSRAVCAVLSTIISRSMRFMTARTRWIMRFSLNMT